MLSGCSEGWGVRRKLDESVVGGRNGNGCTGGTGKYRCEEERYISLLGKPEVIGDQRISCLYLHNVS